MTTSKDSYRKSPRPAGSGFVSSSSTVHVIGASGRAGVALCRSLLADGVAFVPVVRSAERWAALRSAVAPRVAKISDAAALQAALADAAHIVSCAHARYTDRILGAAPQKARLVFLGSTWKFTRWPDDRSASVLAAESAARRPGVLLHPTMIYGAEGEDNVQRLAALLRYLPVVPLPGGGRSLVQPIHQDDLTRAIRASLDHPWDGPTSIVIAGPEPIPYAAFVQAVAAATGLKPPRIVPAPAALLIALAPLTKVLPGVTQIRPEEVRRLLED
jgi:uncharacterized protein YbjT (DUF2867 family)